LRPRLFPAALFAFCLVALPALPEDIAVYDPELPDGYPPKMGDVWGALGDKAVAWETFDFSIGAFDASAWVGAGYEEPVMTLRIMAYPPGEPDTMAGRVFAKAEFGDVLHVGTGMNVEVSIMQGDDIDGVRMSSEGQSAALTIESIGPARENSYNRRLVGNIEARLCPVDWEGQACQDVRLRFDTDVQIESAVMIRE
jgi:hypothetical protein